MTGAHQVVFPFKSRVLKTPFFAKVTGPTLLQTGTLHSATKVGSGTDDGCDAGSQTPLQFIPELLDATPENLSCISHALGWRLNTLADAWHSALGLCVAAPERAILLVTRFYFWIYNI